MPLILVYNQTVAIHAILAFKYPEKSHYSQSSVSPLSTQYF